MDIKNNSLFAQIVKAVNGEASPEETKKALELLQSYSEKKSPFDTTVLK